MNELLKLRIARRVLKTFIQNHHDHNTDGRHYQNNLQTHGRVVAQAKEQQAWQLRVKAAARAKCDVYGNPLENNVPIITGVASYCPQAGKVIYLPRPFRHHHVIRTQLFRQLTTDKIAYPDIQGFVVNDSYFVKRDEALVIATKANQLVDRVINGNKLFSENLWAFWHEGNEEEADLANSMVKTIDVPVEILEEIV